MKGAKAWWDVLTIPTYTRYPERALPRPFLSGWTQLWPERLDDVLGGPKKRIIYDAIILENEHLRLVILPQLGGKLWQVYDKHAAADSIYTPDVIKPGLISKPGAWIPGGMEFNFPIGHHVRTMRSLPCAVLSHGPEVASAVVRRSCARTGMQMDVRISLRRGEARFTIDYTVLNPTPLRHGWYQWTNVGVRETPGWQFQTKGIWFWANGSVHKFPLDERGMDLSWQKNRDWACDSFIVGHREDFFGYYDHDRHIGICHVAPWQKVPGKKYFTWGNRFRCYDSCNVFSDAGHNYLEIQAGPQETQTALDLLEPGEGLEYSTTWIPYRETGGIEWANEELIFNVRDGVPWVFPAINLSLTLKINGRTFSKHLVAGHAVRIPTQVAEGDRIAIIVNGVMRRHFTWPFRGRQEPDGFARASRRLSDVSRREPSSAEDWLERARHCLKWSFFAESVRACRKALALDGRLYEARLLLAEALWHMAEFEAGARQLRLLRKTYLKAEALQMPARRSRAEEDFFGALERIPEGFERELALAEKLACYDNEKRALQIYRRLIKRNPRHWRAIYGLACYYRYRRHDSQRAAQLALRALGLAPANRDLILECVPILMAAGRHKQAIRVLDSAPPAVRKLSLCRKMLAECYLESGQLERGAAIGARYRLYNWEGESRHVDVYQDCLVGLIERALARGHIATARKRALRLERLPKTLGVLFREGAWAKVALWQGVVAWKEGKRERALALWRKGVTRTLAEIEAMEKYTHGRSWVHYASAEATYAMGLCARLIGDPQLIQAADQLLDRCCQAVQRSSGRSSSMALLFTGYRYELEEEFEKAGTYLKRFLDKAATNRFNAHAHLAAMRKGHRRGDVVNKEEHNVH